MQQHNSDRPARSTEEPFFVEGYNGQVSFDGDTVTIFRKGFSSQRWQPFKGEKRIPISALTWVNFKFGTRFFRGYIQFGTASGENSLNTPNEIARNENAILFSQKHNTAFEELHGLVQTAMNIRQDKVSNNVVSDKSDYSQLVQLAELHERGLLSEEEFKKAKKAYFGADD